MGSRPRRSSFIMRAMSRGVRSNFSDAIVGIAFDGSAASVAKSAAVRMS